MATKSLQRSRKELKRRGYATWIAEKPYNPHTKRREDLFNLFDVVGIRADVHGIIGVQACGTDVQDHIRKILEGYIDGNGKAIPPNPYLKIWLEAGNGAFLWSWRLRKFELKSGKRSKRDLYDLREIEFVLKDGQVVAQEISKEVTK